MICDILRKEELTFLTLKYMDQFRILMPNESYYQDYDNTKDKSIQVRYDDEDTPYEYS